MAQGTQPDFARPLRLAARSVCVCLVVFCLQAAGLQGQGKALKEAKGTLTDTNNPALTATLERLEAMGEEAEAEIARWIRENREAAGTNVSQEAVAKLNKRIENRLESVEREFKDVISQYPKNDAVRVAYATFLTDVMRDEEKAQNQLETALSFNPNNPDIYNNLANIYGHIGSVRKAFEFYTKATELNPNEPVYFHNFGTTVYLFRKDVREHYGINEQQVFDKALELYDKSMKLDPTNFTLACDVAMTYYGINPRRTEPALVAWTNALKLAATPADRESVQIHLARVKLLDRRFEEAQAHLNTVTNRENLDLRRRLERNIKTASDKERRNQASR